MANITARPRNTLSIQYKKVTTAYIAKKVSEDVETTETLDYSFGSDGNNTSTAAGKKKIAGIIFNKETKNGHLNDTKRSTLEKVQSVLTKNEYNKGEVIKIPLLKEKVSFEKIDSASLGDEIFIVIETENLQGKEIKINLKQANADGIEKLNDAMTVQQDGTDLRLITATVGDFGSDSTTIENAADFKDWAIAKVILAPKDATKNKEYKASITECENTTTNLYLVIDAESGDNNWFEVLYDEVFDATPNVWLKEEGKQFGLELNSTKTINIYHDGKIDKIDFKDIKELNYVYHDDKGKKHEICRCTLSEIDERKKGVSNDKTAKHTVIADYDENNIISYSHDTSRKKYTYDDGTIRTYGKFYNPDKGTNYRLVTYEKETSKKFLVKMPDSLNKKVNDKTIKYSFTKTVRRYCGPEHLACFIGALAESGLTLKSGGACEEDGTCYPSVSHINGQSIDTSYLKDADEQKFINAMHNFGFDTQLRGSSKKEYNHTTDGGKLHNNHLHSGKLNPNYK